MDSCGEGRALCDARDCLRERMARSSLDELVCTLGSMLAHGRCGNQDIGRRVQQLVVDEIDELPMEDAAEWLTELSFADERGLESGGLAAGLNDQRPHLRLHAQAGACELHDAGGSRHQQIATAGAATERTQGDSGKEPEAP